MAHYLLQKTVHQFISDISDQHQAITNIVITVCGAQLVALGEACMQISLDHQVDVLDWQDVSSRIAEMARIKEALIACGDMALAQEIEPFDETGLNQQQLELTCKSLAESASLMVSAVNILQDFEPMMLTQVQKDVKIAQNLMMGVVQSAVGLLEFLLQSKSASASFREAMQEALLSLPR